MFNVSQNAVSLLAARAHCCLILSLLSNSIPKKLSLESSNTLLLVCTCVQHYSTLGVELGIYSLNLLLLIIVQCSKLSRSLCKALTLGVFQVAAFILIQIRYRTNLSSSHNRLSCTYQRGQSMALLICHLLGVSDASLYLFLKLYHKTELLNYLGTPHTQVCVLSPSISGSSIWYT